MDFVSEEMNDYVNAEETDPLVDNNRTDEEINNLVRQFSTEVSDLVYKGRTLIDVCETRGVDMRANRELVSDVIDSIQDIHNWSWSDAAFEGTIGAGSGLLVGAKLGAVGGLYGATIDGVIGAIFGLNVGTFSRMFCHLIDRIKQIELNFRGLNFRATVN